jgi:hypothetical protein
MPASVKPVFQQGLQGISIASNASPSLDHQGDCEAQRCLPCLPSEQREGRRPHRCPMGVNHGPLPFPLQPRLFDGPRRSHDRHCGPCEADAVMVGECHAPVVAVLLARAQADERMAAPKGRGSWTPRQFFPVNQAFLGGQEWGP